MVALRYLPLTKLSRQCAPLFVYTFFLRQLLRKRANLPRQINACVIKLLLRCDFVESPFFTGPVPCYDYWLLDRCVIPGYYTLMWLKLTLGVAEEK